MNSIRNTDESKYPISPPISPSTGGVRISFTMNAKLAAHPAVVPIATRLSILPHLNNLVFHLPFPPLLQTPRTPFHARA